MTPEEELRRSGKAKDILENEMFKEACGEIEGAILNGIRRAAFKDSELREKLCQQYVTLHAIKDQLRSYIETGELAKEQIRRSSLVDKAKELYGSVF